MYVSDWVDGWNKTGKGRIWKIHDPESAKEGEKVKKLMADGFTHRPMTELAGLLEHPDQRVRQEAQFALAEKGPDAIDTLTGLARNHKNQLARLHALWGLGQIGRQSPAALKALPELLVSLESRSPSSPLPSQDS